MGGMIFGNGGFVNWVKDNLVIVTIFKIIGGNRWLLGYLITFYLLE